MTDREFLAWLRARLIYVYGESENVDFVRRLQTIVEQTTETQTPTAYLAGAENWGNLSRDEQKNRITQWAKDHFVKVIDNE